MAKDPVILRELTVLLDGWPAELGGLRIAHVSDFHFSRWNRLLGATQAILSAVDYDILAITGDFADLRRKWRRTAKLTRRFLEPVAGRRPIYAVLGNHDDPRLAEECGSSVVFLNDRSVTIEHGGTRLQISGVDQNIPRGGDVGLALLNGRQILPTILLAHYPSTALRLPPGRVQLVLSGHTHGGQIRFPGLGCIWPNDRIPREMARGLHTVGPTSVHVSPGIGASLPIRVRINCPPEVTVLKLEPANIGPRTVGTAREEIPPECQGGQPV